MKTQSTFTDVLRFGNEDSQIKFLRKHFDDEVRKKFPRAKIGRLFKHNHFYYQKVELQRKDENNYFSWLIASNWFEITINKDKLEQNFKLAKKQYPDSFY